MDAAPDFEIFEFSETHRAIESSLLAIRLDCETAPTKIVFEYADGETDDMPFPPGWANEKCREWLEKIRRWVSEK
jgi:hypothetical protein